MFSGYGSANRSPDGGPLTDTDGPGRTRTDPDGPGRSAGDTGEARVDLGPYYVAGNLEAVRDPDRTKIGPCTAPESNPVDQTRGPHTRCGPGVFAQLEWGG